MSVIAFVLPTEKTNIFWITYAFTVIAYLAQILIWKTALGKAETLNSKFFGFPVINVGLIYLLIQTVAFIIVVVFSDIIPGWVIITTCSLIFGITAIIIISTQIGKTEAVNVEHRIQKKVSFIKNLQVDIETLIYDEKDEDLKESLTGLAKKLRYCDPMSSDVLESIENKIFEKVQRLKSTDNKGQLIVEINSLVNERNAKCKILK